MEKFKNFIQNSIVQNVLFYITFFLFCLALSIKFDSIENDIFSRLIMGQHVLKTGCVMYHDIFSYAPTHIWFDHEWLSGVIFYIFLTLFGSSGLTILKAIICFSIFIFIDLALKTKENGSYPFRFLYSFIVLLMLSSPHLIFRNIFEYLRCEKFSFVFFAIFLWILELYRKNKNKKLFYSLIPLNIIWLNLHAGSMYILGIIPCYLLGEAIVSKGNLKYLKHYIFVFLGLVLSYLVNPWGFKMVQFLFNSTVATRTYTFEWYAPTIYSMFIIFSLVLIYGLIRNYFKAKGIKEFLKNIDYTKLLIYFATMILALKHQKFMALYVIASAIFIYADFKTLFEDINNILIEAFDRTFSLKYIVIILSILYFQNTITNYDLKTNWYSATQHAYPIKALQFLNDNNIKGKVFCLLDFGNIITYKNYPDMIVYMDTRNEQVYDSEVYSLSMDFFVKGIIHKDDNILTKYDHDIIISEQRWVEANNYLVHHQNYFKLVYEDERFLVFLSPRNQKFSYSYPQYLSNYNPYNFFDTTVDFSKKQLKN